jgi:hypothetical protein
VAALLLRLGASVQAAQIPVSSRKIWRDRVAPWQVQGSQPAAQNLR